ncbi:unnamed protein product, partial [Polarella glacialis]
MSEPIASDVGCGTSSEERTSRLEQLAERARRLRTELGRTSGASGSSSGDSAALHETRQPSEPTAAVQVSAASVSAAASAATSIGGASAAAAVPRLAVPAAAADAQLELIMAADPMLAGWAVCDNNNNNSDGRVFYDCASTGEASSSCASPSAAAPAAAVTPWAAVATAAAAAAAAEQQQHQQLICPGAISSIHSLRVSVNKIELSPAFAEHLATSSRNIALRYVVPAVPTIRGEDTPPTTQDVVMVQCRQVLDGGSTLVFDHASAHQLQLTAETLPELTSQPLLLQLLAESADLASALGPQFSAVAQAEVAWHEALFAEPLARRIEAELLADVGPQQSPFVAGRVSLLVSLHTETATSGLESPESDHHSGDLEAHGVHLKVWMEEVRLKVPSLRGVFLVLKMGPEQEICGHVVGDGQRSEGAELVGQIRTSALSERPAWSIDVKRQKLLRGPEPNNMFLQLWQGVELLGLARVSIPALRNENVRELCSGGSRNCVRVASEDVPILSIDTGCKLGEVRITLSAENPSLAEQSLMRECSRRLFAPTAPCRSPPASRSSTPRSSAQVPGARLANLRLSVPVSNRAVATWFGKEFREHLAEALRISPSRLRIVRVGQEPPALQVEVGLGPPGEPPPQAVLEDLSAQLAFPGSRLWLGGLASYLLPVSESRGLRSSSSSRESSPRPRQVRKASRSPDDNSMAVVAKDLQEQIFQVIWASGVEPSLAFSVLDRDGDGQIAISDFAAVLQELGLRVHLEADVAAALGAGAMRGGQVDAAAFIQQYVASWI